MKNILIIALSILTTYSYAQDCKCEDELKFVVDYYEENLPGFGDNVNKENLDDYINFKNNLSLQSKQFCDDEEMCYKVLLIYVEFFKDNHSSIYTNNTVSIDENDKEAIKIFLESDRYKNREMIYSYGASKNYSIDKITNIYQSKDSTYTVQIIESKNPFRDYAGVIIDAKTPLWKEGAGKV